MENKLKGNNDCEWCEGAGFAVATVYGNTVYREVQKCDECAVYESDDQASAAAEGLNLSTTEQWDAFITNKINDGN